MNWHYDDCLLTADRHVFFKYMARSIAEKHGMRATFMPKPFMNLTGNGCHAHVSVWDKSGKTNLFARSPRVSWASASWPIGFLGGIMHNAEALCSIFNPTVNSYKRINAPRTISGATWSPNTITYTGNNRTHMVRIPDAGRFELRLADGATNPYLLQAGILAAGLDGIDNKRDPGKRLDINMYTEGHKVKGGRKLPLNLLDALRLHRQEQGAAHLFRRQLRQLVLHDEDHRVEFLHPAPDRVGAAEHARLLMAVRPGSERLPRTWKAPIRSRNIFSG